MKKRPAIRSKRLQTKKSWGDGRPHAAWTAQKQKEGLPEGPWAQRRRWCAENVHSHTGKVCRTCTTKSIDASWGPQSQTVLRILASPHLYGSWDAAAAAGWRWYARPRSRSHDHEWWPPQSLCDGYVALRGSLKVPLSTTELRPVLDVMIDIARGEA